MNKFNITKQFIEAREKYLKYIFIIFFSLSLLFLGALWVRGYSTYGAPTEFGNDTTTTCWVGGDGGIVNCTGDFWSGGNQITSGGALIANVSESDPNWAANFTNMQIDCGAGNYSYGIYSNGTWKCRSDMDVDTNVSTICSLDEVLLGNSTCWSTAIFLSTYNETYAGLINNASYLSTFNSTYDVWSYNQTGLGDTNASTICSGASVLLGNSTCFLIIGNEWITPSEIIDVDDADIETDLNTYIDIAGDSDSGSWLFNFINSNWTGNWFKGKFNWTVLTDWLSFDGATLSFNDTKLNETISATGLALGFNSTFNSTYDAYLAITDTNASTECSGASVLLGNSSCHPLSPFFATFNATYDSWAYNQTTPAEDYADANFVSRTDWTTIDNYPSACTGNDVVQGLGDTLSCITPTVTETDPIFLAENASLWSEALNKYNVTYENKAAAANCSAGTVVQNTTSSGVQCVDPTELFNEQDPNWAANFTNMQEGCEIGDFIYDIYGNGSWICGSPSLSETDPVWTANFTNMQIDCGAGNYSYGIYSNGSLKCRDDVDTDTTIGNCSIDGSCDLITYDSELDYTVDTSASVNCSTSEVFLGNGSCMNSDLFYSTYNATYDSFTDTNASTECAGTTTYLDGEGNCDDISGVYVQAADWTTIDNYPAACTGNEFVQGLGDTLSCVTPTVTETDPYWTANLTNGVTQILKPYANSVLDLGTAAARWLKGYFVNLDVSGNVSISENLTIGGSVHVGENMSVSENIYLGDSEGDSYIYFYEGGAPEHEFIRWDDANDRFQISDELTLGGPLVFDLYIDAGQYIKTGGDLYTTGAGDDLWLGTSTQANSEFQAFADGNLSCQNISANTIDAAEIGSTGVIAGFTSCSGIQYLGADGACHTDQTTAGLVTTRVANFSNSTLGVWEQVGSHPITSEPTLIEITFNCWQNWNTQNISIKLNMTGDWGFAGEEKSIKSTNINVDYRIYLNAVSDGDKLTCWDFWSEEYYDFCIGANSRRAVSFNSANINFFVNATNVKNDCVYIVREYS